jgi:hypothetical protein
LHRLALALGRSVDELLDSVTYRELTNWAAYYEAEPWGEWRADARTAQITAMLANVNRDPKKQPKPYSVQDFMMFTPKVEQAAPKASNGGAKIDPTVIAYLFQKSGTRLKG